MVSQAEFYCAARGGVTMSKLASTNIMRKRLAVGGVLAALLCTGAALWPQITAGAASAPAAVPAGDWRGYGYDATGRRFSPLKQIDTGNVSRLRPVWKYGIASGAGDANPANRLASTTEAVPIMVGGILYTPTIQHNIVALEPETGEELWKYDLGKASGTLRGVTYWQGDTDAPPQIFAGTSDGALIALDAKTGKLVPEFGDKGIVDLRPGVTEKFPDAP